MTDLMTTNLAEDATPARRQIAAPAAKVRRGTAETARRSGARHLGRLTDNASAPCNFLKLFGNEGRLQVLCTLAEGERSVSELETLLGIRQSALSQHLARLRAEKVVATRRDGKNIFYSLASDRVRTVIETVYDLFCHDDCAEADCAMKAGGCRTREAD
ncbi:MAG: metalloregulator ArsR/SmtB family transcription factor [Hyphomicrobiales bacterium]